MFTKLVNVLKEVFWIKKSSKRKKASPKRASVKKVTARKKTVAKKNVVKAASKATVKPVQAKKESTPKVKVAKVKTVVIDPNLTEVGVIVQYFDRIKVAVLKINQGTLLIGDKVQVIGLKTRFGQKMWSMQIDRQDIKVAKKGEEIGFKVDKAVELGDKVYK